MASGEPDMVTVLSVELGNTSLDIRIADPVISLISFILEPPLPMREPH
jgi:hypothetical protein